MTDPRDDPQLPLHRRNDPHWVTEMVAAHRGGWKSARWQVLTTAARLYPDAHCLEDWGRLAGIKVAPHRRPSDLRNIGWLEATNEYGETEAGTRVMLYRLRPDLVEQIEMINRQNGQHP